MRVVTFTATGTPKARNRVGRPTLKRTVMLWGILLGSACSSLALEVYCKNPATPLGLPATAPLSNGLASPRLVDLGRALFNDSRLSASGNISCAKCHASNLAFSDGRPTALGAGDRAGTRNTPSLLNVAYQKTLFWDGRVTALEEQVRAPLFNPREHGLSSDRALEDILNSLPEYPTLVEKAFGKRSKPTTDHVAEAIAAYERSLVSGDSVFDRFRYGHDASALSSRERNGLALFENRAGCAQCHTITASYALFTDQQFHASAIPMRSDVSEHLPELTERVRELRARKESKELNELIASDARIAALGRFLSTGNPADINSFQTPSLRNVALTAPYMHDGSVPSLRAAVELELYSRNENIEKPIILTVEEQDDIVAFLGTLSGRN